MKSFKKDSLNFLLFQVTCTPRIFRNADAITNCVKIELSNQVLAANLDAEKIDGRYHSEVLTLNNFEEVIVRLLMMLECFTKEQLP